MVVTHLQFSDTSIYDEIYGYIPLTQIELQLVNHVLFQRLNNIKQLGAAYRVFPGAQHTRFSHSLGVMYTMDRMVTSPNLVAQISVEDRQKLRVAALLHDIGHYPFSHVTETVMTEHQTIGERKHEKLSEYIIAKSSVADILKKNGLDPLEVGQIITGQSSETLFNQLMSSEIDADRIDYLMRDSVHTGVAYGRFDINRLIHTLSLDKSEQLCVEKSGMHAAEGYVIGRYLMWAVVYTHRVTNAFEELIENIYSKCVGSELPSFDQIHKLIAKDESIFARFDDNAIFRIIHKGASDKTVNEMCDMFLNREVLAVAKEAQEISEDGKGEKGYFLLDEFRKDERMQELAKKSEIPREWIFHSSSRTQLPSLKPFVEKTPIEEEQKGREMSKAIRMVDEKGNSVPLASTKNSIVYYLRNMSLDKVRIYTREGFCNALEKVLTKEISGAQD
jgi:HD superfamily phosphohydrolase